MNDKPILLCLTGFTGVGKTTVKNMFSNYPNVKTFYTKDLHKIILGEYATSTNKIDISLKFDDKLNFIRNVMNHINKYKEDSNIVVLDSIRSTTELDYIRTLPEYTTVKLIHVSSDEKLRKKRLLMRDNCSIMDIKKRDLRDTGEDNTGLFNMKDLFKWSDYTINTSHSLASINKQVYMIIQSLPKKVKELNIIKTMSNKEKQHD